jgi:protein phosphatase
MDEVTAEYQVAELVKAVPLRVKPCVTVAMKTDMGRIRENNEDKAEFYIPENPDALAGRGVVFVVCDGMGGHEAGQIASELAVKTFLDVYLHHPAREVESALQAAVAAANRFVLDVARAVPNRRGMGTTLSALVLVQDRGYIAHVGDSRVYRLRGGALEMLTVDHTWVEEMVRGGVLSREEAERSERRHMLVRAVGTESDWTPDILTFGLERGDVYLLCSDGVTNHVTDIEIGSVLAGCGPSEAAWKLVGSALSAGGTDNATCVVARLDDLKAVQPTE